MSVFDKYKPVPPTTSVFSKYKPIQANSQSNSFVQAGDAVGQAGASAAGTVAKGVGNAASVTGQVLEAFDPIAQAQNVSKLFGGGGFGYTSPARAVGETIKKGTYDLANAAEQGSVKTSTTGQNKTAQWTGGALGNIANSIGATALTPSVGTTGFFGKVLPQSVVGTSMQSAINQGRMANAQELATGAAIDSALYGAGKLFKGIRDLAYSNVLRQTPGDKKMLLKKGIDAGQELSDAVGFAPTKKVFDEKLAKATSKAGANISDEIAKAKSQGFSFNKNDLSNAANSVDDYISELTRSAPITERAAIRDKALKEVQAIKSEIAKSGNSIDDLVRLKRTSDAVVPYDKLNPVVNASVAPYKAVADRTRSLLPEGVQIANAKYEPLRALSDIAKNRPATSGFAGDVVGMAAGGNWKDKIFNVAAQRLYRTPLIQTGVASLSNIASKAANSPITGNLIKSGFMGRVGLPRK